LQLSSFSFSASINYLSLGFLPAEGFREAFSMFNTFGSLETALGNAMMKIQITLFSAERNLMAESKGLSIPHLLHHTACGACSEII
jgi:hypothetical protein